MSTTCGVRSAHRPPPRAGRLPENGVCGRSLARPRARGLALMRAGRRARDLALSVLLVAGCPCQLAFRANVPLAGVAPEVLPFQLCVSAWIAVIAPEAFRTEIYSCKRMPAFACCQIFNLFMQGKRSQLIFEDKSFWWCFAPGIYQILEFHSMYYCLYHRHELAPKEYYPCAGYAR